MSVATHPDHAALLNTLQQWAEQGWIRRLDHALARFLADLCPQAPPQVLLAAALLAQLEGRGHTCLPLADLLDDADGLLAWPAVAAVALRAELARWPGTGADWCAALQGCDLVDVDDGAAPSGAATGRAPLVLRGQRLYLRRYWDFERRVAAQVLQRVATADTPDPAQVRPWLDALFPAPEPAAPAQPAWGLHAEGNAEGNAEENAEENAEGNAAVTPAASPPASRDASRHASPDVMPDGADPDWQKIACAVALRGRLAVITGGPGTGKTYTAARLLALLLAVSPQPDRLRVALAAPTGKAAARLRQAIETALAGLQQQLGDRLALTALATHIGPARTLHGLLGVRPDSRRFRADAAHPLAVDVLIVDEASMVHLEMMAALLDALPPQARLVLLGDKDQLASVEAGAVLGDLCRGAEHGHYRYATAQFAAAAAGQVLPPALLTGGSALAQQTVMLRRSRRFGGPIGQLALAVNTGNAAAAAALLRPPPDGAALPGRASAGLAGLDKALQGPAGLDQAPVGPAGLDQTPDGPAVPDKAPVGPAVLGLDAPSPAVVWRLALQGRDGAAGGYRRYLRTLQRRPKGLAPDDSDDAATAAARTAAWQVWVLAVLADFERFRLLCAVREGEWGCDGLNRAVERVLVADGLLVKRGEWYEGRPVMVTRNDPGIGVFNGDIGIVLRPRVPTSPLRAWFADGPALRSVGVSRLASVETAFAMTVHKAQGSEFDHTVLVLPQAPSRGLTRELVYTGITRARSAFTLVSGRREALADALARRTRRASGLLNWLDQPGPDTDPADLPEPLDPPGLPDQPDQSSLPGQPDRPNLPETPA